MCRVCVCVQCAECMTVLCGRAGIARESGCHGVRGRGHEGEGGIIGPSTLLQ